MKRVGITAPTSLVIATLLTGCGGGADDSVDALPQISLATNAVVKEKKTTTITATATDDKSISGYDWQQISGPTVTLAQAKTATLSVTAPAVDADSSAELRLTVTDSAGQTAQKTISLAISNNKAPTVTFTNSSSLEKKVVQLNATASDSDGTISTYTWTQTTGPAVQLTGATTATPSFTAPAVTVDTPLTFSLQVADDDNETASASATVTVMQQLVNYTISGSASATAFANADVTVTADGQAVSTKTNAQGQFTALVKTDDDTAPPSFGQVTLKSATVTGLEYAAFLRDFVADEPVAAAASFSATTQSSVTLSVNEASTALFALIKQANNGEVPADIADFVLLEKFLDADELLEATAVARIAAQGTIALPQGITLVQLLSDNTAYSAYVTAVEQTDPGIITRNINAIIADPTVTPPVTAVNVPSVYYETTAAGERFLPYGATPYRFKSDGTGYRKGINQLTENYTWSVVDGAIEMVFDAGNSQTEWVSIYSSRVQTLGAATIQRLKDNGILQVQAISRITKIKLQRLMSGERIDTFRNTFETSYDILPLMVGNETLDPGILLDSQSYNTLMKNGDALASLTFTNAELIGKAFNIQHRYAVPNPTNSPPVFSIPVLPKTQSQMDLLEFKTGGVGVGTISQVAFTWLIDASGKLQIKFATGESAEVTKVDQAYGLISNLTKNFDINNILVGEDMLWMVDSDVASITNQSFVNHDNFYWQTMINLWWKSCWAQSQLFLGCGETDYSSFFGFQLLAGERLLEHSTLDTENGPSRVQNSRTWRVAQDGGTIEIVRGLCGGAICRLRVWWPLKVETIDGKRRLWVLESQGNRSSGSGELDNGFIPFRINAFDEIPLDTPDAPPAENIEKPRLIMQPSTRQTSEI